MPVSYTHLDVYKRQQLKSALESGQKRAIEIEVTNTNRSLGTIWDDDMVIPESTLEAVAALKANGHLAFICQISISLSTAKIPVQCTGILI